MMYDVASIPGVVVDEVTGLMWQQAAPAGTSTQSQAQAYCAGLTLAGHCDWRLPTRIELVSIVDFTQTGPAIDSSAFPATQSSFFWTSSPLAGGASGAWFVNFYQGTTYSNTVTSTDTAAVRCVR